MSGCACNHPPGYEGSQSGHMVEIPSILVKAQLSGFFFFSRSIGECPVFGVPRNDSAPYVARYGSVPGFSLRLSASLTWFSSRFAHFRHQGTAKKATCFFTVNKLTFSSHPNDFKSARLLSWREHLLSDHAHFCGARGRPSWAPPPFRLREFLPHRLRPP